MAADSRKSTSELLISKYPKKNRNRTSGNGVTATGSRDLIFGNGSDTGPISIEPKSKPVVAPAAVMAARRVPVLYYLTRNGHLEHPHLIDVPLSSPDGLYLRDVMNTLNHHRGKGMADLYSWSFKRSYRNGYVWHDLSEDDLVQPTNGHDYILKGSELLRTHTSQNPQETNHSGEDCSSPATAMIKRRNQSWSSFDNPQEYMVVKGESNRELAAKFPADAATQTEEQRRRRSFDRERKEHVTMALRKEEVPSPPPSNSSSEGVNGRRYVHRTTGVRDKDLTVQIEHDAIGRTKASQVLMQLITCGAPSRLKM